MTCQLILWPKTLTVFEYSRYVHDVDYVDLPMVQSWLQVHKCTLRYINIGKVSAGFEEARGRLFNAKEFPNLEELHLSRWDMSRTLDSPMEDADLLLGLEAARHFYYLNAAKVILAVRTVSKGETAKEDILSSVTTRNDANAIEVWPLHQVNTLSTLAFSERAQKELPRVDAAVLNAVINTKDLRLVEGYEQVTQVNVLNTFLLVLMMLPKLLDTKTRFADSSPHLTIVSSEA